MQKSASSKWQLALASLAIGVICWVSAPVPAYADCSSDNPAGCVYVPQSKTVNVSPAFPNADPSCQEVTNNCAAGLMVPTTNQAEWTSFLDSGIATGDTAGIKQCVKLANCACATTTVTNGTVGSYPGCVITCDSGYNLSGSSCVPVPDSYSYAWNTSDWGACSGTCGTTGSQSRTVSCSQTDTTTDTTTTVDNSVCVANVSAEPSSTNACAMPACAAPTASGTVDIELYWDEIWRQKAPASFKEFIGIVPNSSCSPGENYAITGVTISISPTAPGDVSSGLSALAKTITGKTFQCRNVTVEIGVGEGSGYVTDFGIGFLSTVYGYSAYGFTPYARSIGVVKSDGSSGTLIPNSSFLLTTTSWSLQ